MSGLSHARPSSARFAGRRGLSNRTRCRPQEEAATEEAGGGEGGET